MAQWVKIGPAEEIPVGQAKVFVLKEHRLAVSHLEDGFFAIEDTCTHDNGPLGEGELDGEELECPRHGARFNVKTGQAVIMPAVIPVKTFSVKVTDGQLFIELPDPPPST